MVLKLWENLQGIREGDEDIEVSPIKWHTKVTAIQEAKDLTKLPMEELIGSLMTYEINLIKKLQEGIFIHGDKEKWEEKRELTCFKCKKSGHIKYDCPLYKSEAKRRMKKAMMATWSESEESSEEENEKEVANMCFMAIDDLDEGSKKDKWFLDSGCSRHMTGDESKFAFLTKRKEDTLPLETIQKKDHWSRQHW
ncbi:hypothetical protein CK203_030468 [Vitis vinifera]|uniref:CCHC-type domain-containing protein n=1 Tax=Vitis vinifera TaxID=29760 RepID=A0A438JDM6_VITVI|nr:hypothetical protein CK203_030468 [Vitis vinifera]